MRRRQAIILLLLGYWAFGVAGGLLATEGGSDEAHRWLYFIATNAMGIPSTALLMGVYSRMNVNLAMVIATSGAFVLGQLALWAVYRAPITLTEWIGIGLVGVGIALAVRPSGKPHAAASTNAPPAPLPQPGKED